MAAVAIIMTVYNRLQQTRKCIESLEMAFRSVPHRYFITNDGSNDGTAEYLSNISEKMDVQIYQGDGSLFWNRGMYHSYQNALRGAFDFYLWVNNDTVFYPDMFQTLMRDHHSAQGQNEICVICGSVRSKTNGLITYGGTGPNGLIPPTGSIQPCTHINGNCLLIPWNVAKRIGNLDYHYEHGLGDFDYGMRIRQAGGALFVSSSFVGTCEKNSIKNTWKDVSLPVLQRIRLMKTKTGQPRASYRHYLRKWNKSDWFLYYWKPYFDIVLGRIKYLLGRKNYE